jgi:hypothetical protein
MRIAKITLSILLIPILVLVGCNTPKEEKTTPHNYPGFYESNFNFIFRYGVGAKNELNTFNGIYTKDMVADPSITVELSLSEEELDSIYEKMVEIDFFNYPDNFTIIVPPNKPHGIVTPYSSYYFKVQHDLEIKELWWADEIIYEAIQADKLKELINLIRDIIESKDEYKSLPESKGGYM